MFEETNTPATTPAPNQDLLFPPPPDQQLILSNCPPFSRHPHRLRHMVLKNSGRMVGKPEAIRVLRRD